MGNPFSHVAQMPLFKKRASCLATGGSHKSKHNYVIGKLK